MLKPPAADLMPLAAVPMLAAAEPAAPKPLLAVPKPVLVEDRPILRVFKSSSSFALIVGSETWLIRLAILPAAVLAAPKPPPALFKPVLTSVKPFCREPTCPCRLCKPLTKLEIFELSIFGTLIWLTLPFNCCKPLLRSVKPWDSWSSWAAFKELAFSDSWLFSWSRPLTRVFMLAVRSLAPLVKVWVPV